MCTCTMYFYTSVIFENFIWFCQEFISLYHIFSMQYVRLFNTIEGKLKWNSGQSLPIKEYVLVDPLFWSFIQFTGSTLPIYPNPNHICIIADVGLIFD